MADIASPLNPLGDFPVATSAQISRPDGTRIESSLVAVEAVAPVGKNKADLTAPGVVDGYYINAVGTLVANSTYSVTDYVPVLPGTTYTRSFANQSAWYDSNKAIVAGGPATATFTTPDNVAFIRMTVLINGKGTFQLETGNVATTYAPYGRYVAGASLQDASVSLSKTSFAQAGKNLANQALFAAAFYISSATGVPTANASYSVTDFIPVTAGTTYSRSFAHQMAWYTAAKVFISGVDGSAGATLVAPANAAFARLTLNPGASFQFEIGAAPTAYAPFGPVIALSALPAALAALGTGLPGALSGTALQDATVDISKVTFVQPGKNLFNPNDAGVVPGYFVSSAGTLVANATYTASGFIPVTAGTTYARSFANQMAWFSASKTFISGLSGTDGTAVTAPAGAAFARLTMIMSSTFQFEVGSAPTAYAAYGSVISMAVLPAALAGLVGNTAVSALSGRVLQDATVDISKVSFAAASKNLFNPADAGVSAGNFVSSGTGNLTANATYTASGFIPVVAGTTYARNYSNQMAWFTAAKVYISGQSSADGAIVTAPAGAAFARVTIAAVAGFQFEVGAAVTSYLPYGATINQSALPAALAPLAAASGFLDENALPRQACYRLDRLRRAHSLVYQLGKLDAAQLHVAFIADSWGHIPTRYTGPVTADLLALPGSADAGPGWQGFGYFGPNGPNGNVRNTVYTMARTGTWSDAGYNASESPDICSASTTDTATAAKYSLAGPDASLLPTSEHWYIGTAAGVIQYRWNNGPWTQLDVSGAGLQFASILTGKPVAGAWTLEMQLVSGSWNPAGNNYFTSARGVRVSKLAGSGSQAATWAARGADWRKGISRLNPDLVVIMLLTNDRTAGYSPAQYKASLATILTNVRAALPTGVNAVGATPAADILLVIPPGSAEPGLPFAQTEYAKAVYPLADEHKCGFIDLQRVMGEQGTFDGWFVEDKRHPDTPMSRVTSSVLFRAITNPY